MDRAPTIVRLLHWMLAAVPASMMFLCRPPAEGSGQTWGRWCVRTTIVLPLLGLFYVLFPLIVVATVVARVVRPELVDTLARTAGDAVHFSRGTKQSDEMVRLVVAAAQRMAIGKQRLVVVAHSQGGAVTWRAIQEQGWPSVPTEVITLGSGHNRLLTLRYLKAKWYRRFGLFAWNMAMAFVATCLVLSSAWAVFDELRIAESTVAGIESFVVSLIMFFLLGSLLFVFSIPIFWAQHRTSRIVADAIGRCSIYWLDVWSTNDVVPDGSMNLRAWNQQNLPVVNRRSLLVDHVTYHLNAPGVLAAIVHRIDMTRLSGHHAAIQDLRAERKVRTDQRALGLVPRALFSASADDELVLRAEFTGRRAEPVAVDEIPLPAAVGARLSLA